MSWDVVLTRHAQKDAQKIVRSNLRTQVERLLEVIRHDPHAASPPFEKLVGDLRGAYSRRINNQHRLVYVVMEDIKTIKVISMWSHYE